MNDSTEDLWDVQRAAQFLGMTIEGVYRAAERGQIPSIKVLRLRRFVPATLRAWAQARSEGPAKDAS
jgi:hypothetical protein